MNNKTITILRMTELRGPSIWTYRPAVEAVVDIADLEDCPSNVLPGFNERLSAWLPGLVEHRCSVGRRGGFLMRLRDGTWPAHIMEHVAIELQNMAGLRTGFGKARETGERGVYKVVIRSEHAEIGKFALHAARDLLMAAIDNTPFDVTAPVRELKAMGSRLCLGPSTAAIVDAAAERGIPALRLNDGNLVQLGQGAFQRRIWTAETDRTSAIAEGIAGDKHLTKELLGTCGVPIPRGTEVESAEEAWEFIHDLGAPGVVKPIDGNHARGVSLNLTSRDEVFEAYEIAKEEGSGVLAEAMIAGSEHRLLIVGGKLAAATRGRITQIRGDGKSTVRELIDRQLNADPRRGDEENVPLEPIVLPQDKKVMLELLRQGLTPDSVPDFGQLAVVERTGNMCEDVTDIVHPEVAAEAALAARVVGLDIAGIDLVTTDISRPLQETGGAIVEVNAGPGLLMHLKPSEGKPRPVGKAIVDHLFPPGETAGIDGSARMLLVGVLGGSEASLTARLIAGLIQLQGQPTALACADGLFLGNRILERMDSRGWGGGERVLMSRHAKAGVIETSAWHILNQGLPYDRCNVGIVTRMPGTDGLADHYITRTEQMPNVARTQIDVVLKHGFGILNADDAAVAEMAPLCDGEVLMYSTRSDNAAFIQHRLGGGRGVFVRDGEIVLCAGEHEIPVLPLARIDLSGMLQAQQQAHPGSSTTAQVLVAGESTLALPAIAAAWALGIPLELIGAALAQTDHLLATDTIF
ncbi:cyanophycin synthetase [Comamonas serinivorans]|uniref:Cyanophycin synthetase n=1 Tax=Comamonas serinivorans TaxID=1082851 RepID=A0A1Y0EN18_9BURK|nr:cyanophycin synthetase [Comamonas serinivorans]ARU04976.1 cyanophycin synthetase [Comamonas serinivorans]